MPNEQRGQNLHYEERLRNIRGGGGSQVLTGSLGCVNGQASPFSQAGQNAQRIGFLVDLAAGLDALDGAGPVGGPEAGPLPDTVSGSLAGVVVVAPPACITRSFLMVTTKDSERVSIRRGPAPRFGDGDRARFAVRR